MAVITETPSSDLASAQIVPVTAFDTEITSPPFDFYPSLPTVVLDGAINVYGDQDYWRITLRAGDVLTLDVDASWSTSDLQMFLYNAAGALIASNDDLGFLDTGSTTIRDPFLAYNVIGSGTYFIGLQARLSLTGNDHATNYDLNVTIASPALVLRGTAGADLVEGWMGHDVLNGGAPGAATADTGGDTLTGLGGRDLLDGGGGADLLLGGADADRLLGGAGNDTIWGDGPGIRGPYNRAYQDVVSGGDGDDLLIGGDGRDTVDGGAGADTISDDYNPDAGVFQPEQFSDPSAAGDVLSGGDGDDVIRGAERDRLLGGAGDDLLRLNPRFLSSDFTGAVADGGEGTDRLVLGFGASAGPLRVRLDADGNGQAVSNGVAYATLLGIEAISVTGSSLADELVGGAGGDSLVGLGGADTLTGGGGNDSIAADAADQVAGGSGDDSILAVGLPDLLDAGSGNDTLVATASVTGFVVSAGVGNDSVSAEGALATITLGSGNDTVQATGTGAAIDAGAGGDLIILGGAVDAATAILADNAFADGGAGADIFRLWGGQAVLQGGANFDNVELDLSRIADPVTITFYAVASGMMTASSAHWISWDSVERLKVIGGSAADAITGSNSNDTIDGGGGADTMRGGGHYDLFRIGLAGAAGDVVADFAGRGELEGDRIEFHGFGTGATVTFLGGTSWLASGSLGSATISISGGLHPTDYVFVAV